MDDLRTNIQTFLQTRQRHAEMIADVLSSKHRLSETDFCSRLLTQYKAEPDFFDSGWYDPPPGGVAALFAQPPEYNRLHYGSLRKPESWPKSTNSLEKDSIGFVYGSPVSKATGVHGDMSLTIYLGDNPSIQKHLANALRWHEMVAEFIQVGMEFREIFVYAKSLTTKDNRINGCWLRQRAIDLTTSSATEAMGDTVPWTNELPTKQEQAIIEQADINEIKELIRQKRLYISNEERFKVPDTIVITVETILEDAERPELPLALFYLMVVFNQGQKQIVSNYASIFKATSMDRFMKPKY